MNGREDRQRFAVVLFWLAKRMKDQGGMPKVIDDELIADYFDALHNMSIERIEWAAKELFAKRIWFPMPAEIREFALQAPASVLPSINLTRPALPEATYYDDGSRKLAEIVASFGDDWGLPTTRRGRA